MAGPGHWAAVCCCYLMVQLFLLLPLAEINGPEVIGLWRGQKGQFWAPGILWGHGSWLVIHVVITGPLCSWGGGGKEDIKVLLPSIELFLEGRAHYVVDLLLLCPKLGGARIQPLGLTLTFTFLVAQVCLSLSSWPCLFVCMWSGAHTQGLHMLLNHTPRSTHFL